MSEIIDVLGEEVDAAVDTPLVVIEGTKGDPGKDGITPTIGPNGNWYLGEEDTGKPSRGVTGAKGDAGATGPAGPVGPQGPAGASGKDGHSPVVTATKFGKTTIISVDGTDIAAVNDGADGKPGAAGADGVTPHIGDNGNWYLGDEDTGVAARGAKGDTGQAGPQGPAGSDASVTAANIEAAMGYKPADPTKYLPLTGGKLTGNLDGKYITGTWLKSTDAGHQEEAATKVAVLDAQGWIYYRTPAELMVDMGLADGTEVSY